MFKQINIFPDDGCQESSLGEGCQLQPNDPGLLLSTQLGEKGTDPCQLPAGLHPHVLCHSSQRLPK